MITDPIENVDLFDDEPAGYDPVSEAVRFARYGLSVSPWVLTGRDKNPAFASSWLDNATADISDVVQDFEHAASRYGTDRILVGWAVGKDGYCAIDDDHGLADSVALVLDHPHAVNQTYRGGISSSATRTGSSLAIPPTDSRTARSVRFEDVGAASSSPGPTVLDSTPPSSPTPPPSHSRNG